MQLEWNKPTPFFLSSFLVHACFFVFLLLLSLQSKTPIKKTEIVASVHFVPKSFVKKVIVPKPSLNLTKPSIVGISRPSVSSSNSISKPVLSTSRNSVNRGNTNSKANTPATSTRVVNDSSVTTKATVDEEITSQGNRNQEEEFLDATETEPVYTAAEIRDLVKQEIDALKENESSNKKTTTRGNSSNKINLKEDRIAYQSAIQAIVKDNFSVSNVQKSEFLIEINVSIKSDGSIAKIEFISSSKVAVLNKAAERALRLSEPFPKFPESFNKDELFLAKFRFDPSFSGINKKN